MEQRQLNVILIKQLEKLENNKSVIRGYKMKNIQKIMPRDSIFEPINLSNFGTDPKGAYFEVDNWSGIVGFENTIPGDSCSILFLPWKGEGWKSFHTHEVKRLIDRVVKCLRLKKIELRSENIKNKETRKLEALLEKNQYLECESR